MLLACLALILSSPLLTLGIKMCYLNLHRADHVTSPLLPPQHPPRCLGLCQGRLPKTPTPRSLTPPAKHPIKGTAVVQPFMPANADARKRNGMGKERITIEHHQQHWLSLAKTGCIIIRGGCWSHTKKVLPSTKSTDGDTVEKHTGLRLGSLLAYLLGWSVISFLIWNLGWKKQIWGKKKINPHQYKWKDHVKWCVCQVLHRSF